MFDLASAISQGIFADPRENEVQVVSQKIPESERIRALTAALKDALEGMEEMYTYVPQYFREKWEHEEYITRARRALGEA